MVLVVYEKPVVSIISLWMRKLVLSGDSKFPAMQDSSATAQVTFEIEGKATNSPNHPFNNSPTGLVGD